MDKGNKNTGKLKLYDVLATFNDSTFFRGSVMAENNTVAYQNFIVLPEIVETLKDESRKILQCTMCERELN